MQTYITILRGINVSGQRMIKMDELKNMFQKLGFKNVQTYIQSGNAIFQAEEIDISKLEKLISGRIKDTFSFDVPVLVMTSVKLNEVYTHNPFLSDRNEDISKLHVTFLSRTPENIDIDKIHEINAGKDEFFVKYDTVYLFCPDGYGNTKLSNTFFESKLKVVATTRNWKTVTELLRLTKLSEQINE